MHQQIGAIDALVELGADIDFPGCHDGEHIGMTPVGHVMLRGIRICLEFSLISPEFGVYNCIGPFPECAVYCGTVYSGFRWSSLYGGHHWF